MTNAIFWIANGERYAGEAEKSAESVARQMPDTPRILLCPDTVYVHNFTHTVRLPARSHSLWYVDFVAYMNQALGLLKYDKLLYLDTDTWMCAPVGEVFDLLDRFDIASTHAPARTISPTSEPVPACFAEYNTGVLAFNNSKMIKQIFAAWLKTYLKDPALYGENDQAPLREVLWGWVWAYVLPPEYNCRFGFGGQAAGMIKILHGRSNDIAALARRINDDQGIRGWRRGDFE